MIAIPQNTVLHLVGRSSLSTKRDKSVMPKAFSYLRFSTPEQSKGDSLRRQIELSRKFAADNGLELDETLTFEDLGVSAFHGKNAAEGALGDFIRAVDEGRIPRGSYLLVESLDRLSRDTVGKAFTQLQSLLDRGIYVVTMGDGQTYTPDALEDDFTRLLISLLVMYRAHEESATKSKRLSAAWHGKRLKASANGEKLTSRAPEWLKLSDDRQSFDILEERAEVVRRIFELTIQGVGAAKIATTLNEELVPTFGRSNGWHPSYVKKILANEAVVGRCQLMKYERGADGRRRRIPEGEPIEDYYPIVIDRETFLRAAQMRKGRKIEGGRKGERFSNLFTGLAICGACGGPMHFINKGLGKRSSIGNPAISTGINSSGHYLACSTARRRVTNSEGRRICVSPSWKYQMVETFILNLIREIDFRDLFPAAFANTREELTRIEGERLVAEDELATIARRLNSLLSALAERPNSETLLSELDRLEASKSEVADRLKRLCAEAETQQERLTSLAMDHTETRSALSKFYTVQREGDANEVYRTRSRLHQLLKRTIDRIEFTPLFGSERLVNDVERHGTIHIFFSGAAEHARVIWVRADQDAAYSVVFKDGVRENGVGEIVPNQTYLSWRAEVERLFPDPADWPSRADRSKFPETEVELGPVPSDPDMPRPFRIVRKGGHPEQ